jgi:hypothetical protein
MPCATAILPCDQGHLYSRHGRVIIVPCRHLLFPKLYDEFVTKDRKESKDEIAIDLEDVDADENAKKRRASKRGAQLMQAEERNVGAVNVQVYKQYFRSGNGKSLLPAMIVSVVLMQTAIMLSSYWCVHHHRDYS